MPRIFGTDGVRGIANADLTPELALRLATAAAQVLTSDSVLTADIDTTRRDPAALRRGNRPIAVVGRDPRASGEMLEAAVCAGLASAGVDVFRLGVLPTPAIAFLTADLGADLGIVISASHNAMPDNGIKIFARGGRKLPNAAEDAIEAAIGAAGELPIGDGVGRISDFVQGVRRYTDHLLLGVPSSLAGIKVVVDCAHGAASAVAPETYRRAGADVIVIGAEPDGWNINDGVGSTHMDELRKTVIETGADLGIAHDGDADRCLAVAHDGQIIDGDVILGLLAFDLDARNELAHKTVVTTVMANLGFHRAMAAAGIAVRTTAVGDRYVLSDMQAGGYSLGGEQSGHIIVSRFATTGDGLLTALSVMAMLANTQERLADLARRIPEFPQLLINVPVADKPAAMAHPAVIAALAQAEVTLRSAGRVLLRPSGTESLIRVMVEAEDPDVAEQVAQTLADVVRTATATTATNF